MTTIQSMKTMSAALLMLALGCSNAGPQPGQPAPAAGGAAPASATSASSSFAGDATTPPGGAASSDASSTPGSAAPAAVPDDEAVERREVTIPAGTALSVVLETPVASDQSGIEDPVRGHLSKAIQVRGEAVVPENTPVEGRVTAVNLSGKVKGRAAVAFRLTTLTIDGEPFALKTPDIRREAPGTKREDAKKIGIGAAGGAIVGAIVGGKKGAAVGTAVGGGAGTGVVLATKGEEIRLPAGTVVTTRLLVPAIVRVPVQR